MYGIGGEHRLTELELPWLSGYEAGTRRQCRERAVPARHLRRGAGGALPRIRARAAPARPDALAGNQGRRRDRARRAHVARAGRGDLGDPRQAAALHLLQGLRLDRDRSRHQVLRGDREVRLTAGEPLATRSMPRSWPKATTPSATRSSSTTAGTAWMRACCSSRSPAFCQRTTRASWARSTRSSRRSARGPSSGATRRRTAWTGLPAVKGHFSSVASGW